VIEECIFGGGNLCGVAESLAQTRIEVLLKPGQQGSADAVAEELGTKVGGIMAKGLAKRVQELLYLLSSCRKHRADEAWPLGGFLNTGKIPGQVVKIEAAVNSYKAAGSGAAKQAQQNGLCLIVAGVGGGHAVKTKCDGGALKECVTGTAACSLQREMKERGKCRDIFGLDGRFQPKLRGNLAYKALVRVRLGPAQPVIEMEDTRHDPETWSKLNQCAQQRHRISAPADGHANALAGTDQAMLAQVGFERP
jgi:hypothetical protein